VAPGKRNVELAVGDSADPEVFEHQAAREVDFKEGESPAVVFDRDKGFVWHFAAP
jgi:hypothetical protein